MKTNRWMIEGAAALLLAASATSASAGRPFATEDAGVIGPRACELETYGIGVEGGGQRSKGGWLQVGCGLGGSTQLALGGGNLGSVQSLALVGKTAMVPLTDASTGVALAYGTSVARGGEGNDRLRGDASFASLVLSMPLTSSLVAHANLGVLQEPSVDMKSTWAAALEWRGPQGLDLGVEAYGAGSDAAFLGVGARYALKAERAWIDFSWAAQTSGDRQRVWTIGLKLAF